jgi:hypothetical protein
MEETTTTNSSEASSSSSWDDICRAAAWAALVAAQEVQVPRSPPRLGLQRINGAQFTEMCLLDPKRMKCNFRMFAPDFLELHDCLVDTYELRGTRNIGSREALAMLLFVLAKQRGQRDVEDVFAHSLSTVSTKIAEVLDCLVNWAHSQIKPRPGTAGTIHKKLFEYSPLFDGCIGAIDGTHVRLIVPRHVHDDYINRKGWTSQNVVAVCDFEQHFTYVGVGSAGAMHDMSILRQAWLTPTFPHPDTGK